MPGVMVLERYCEAIVESTTQERCYLDLSLEGLLQFAPVTLTPVPLFAADLFVNRLDSTQ